MKLFVASLLFGINTVCVANGVDSLKNLLNGKNQVDQIPILLDLAWHTDIELQKRNEYALQAFELAVNLKNNTQLFEALKVLADVSMSMNDLPNAKKYNTELGNLALQYGDKQTAGVAYNTLGLVFQKTAKYDSALIYYQKAIDKFDVVKAKKNKARAMVNVGIIYKNIGFYKDAVEITLNAINTIEAEEDTTTLASAYNNIGISLKELRNYKEAEYYLKKALKIRSEQRDTIAEAGVLNNLGNVYRHWGKFDEALQKYKESLSLKEKLGDKVLLASTIDNIGEVYINLKKYDLSEIFFKQALLLRIEVNYIPGIITSSNRLANFFLEKSMLDSATFFVSKAANLSESSNSRKEKLETYRLLKLIKSQQGEFKGSLYYANRYIELYDSLYSEEKSQVIANIEVKYRTEQYAKDLVLSLEKEKTHLEKIKNQSLLIGILVICFTSITVISLLIFKSFKAKKKAEELEKTLRKELQHRIKNNLQLISNTHRLQMSQITDPAIKRIIQENENRVLAISLVHQNLYRDRSKSEVELQNYIPVLFNNIRQSFYGQIGYVRAEYSIGENTFAPDVANSIGLILNELITNAFKYSFENVTRPFIKIKVTFEKGQSVFDISHSNNHLWNYEVGREKQGSFGLNLVEMLLKQLNGEIRPNISSVITQYIISIPYYIK